MRSSPARDMDIKGEPQARYPPGPGRQDMESTVTLVRLANRLSSTTKALSVHSAARPSALSSDRADRSCRRELGCVEFMWGRKLAGCLPAPCRRERRRAGKARRSLHRQPVDEHRLPRPTLLLLQPSHGKRLHRLRTQLQSPCLVSSCHFRFYFSICWAPVLAAFLFFGTPLVLCFLRHLHNLSNLTK